jgi:ribosomal protein S18 acetylase RimI-like enzyme
MIIGPVDYQCRFSLAQFDCGSSHINERVRNYTGGWQFQNREYEHLAFVDVPDKKARKTGAGNIIGYVAASHALLDDDNYLTAHLGVSRTQRETPLSVEIHVLAVDKAHQRTGLGRALLAAAAEVVMENYQGCVRYHGIELMAATVSVPAYMTMGFERVRGSQGQMFLSLEKIPFLCPSRPGVEGSGLAAAAAVAKKRGLTAG